MSLNLIFDLDDTLYDLASPFKQAHIDLFAHILGEDCSNLFRMSRVYSDEILELEKLGKVPSQDTFFYRIKKTYADAGLDVDRETADKFEEKYRYYQQHITVPDGIKDILDACKLAGHSMSILTNGKVKGQGNKIKALDLYRWFSPDKIFISEVTGFIKPDLEVFRYAEEQLGLKPQNIWYVGDTYEADVLGAKRAGWNVIWYNHRNGRVPEAENAADYTVHTPEQLLSVIQEIIMKKEGKTMKNFEHLEEIKQGSEEIFDGQVVHLFKDTVKLPNGKSATRETIRHIGAVAIVPLTDDGKVIVERQFRYPLNRVITEIPAGKLDSKTEDRLAAAKRELEEETGYIADEWIEIGDYYPAAAYCDEVITIYLAKGLHTGNRNLDEDEFLNIMAVDLDELVADIMNGKIADGKTQVALLKTHHMMK